MVTPSRRIHPSVENSDTSMWSRTKTWLRSMDRRSRYSGRSWCATVATVAGSRATWDSSAMVTLSRKRRCTRVLTVRRNQVAAADTPRPIAAPCINPVRCSRKPLPSSARHNARSASGRAASSDTTTDTTIRRGWWRYPSLHSRHIDDSAGGSGSSSDEGLIGRSLLFCKMEALRLQVEHGPIAAAQCHQLVVRAQLDDAAVLQHADAVSMADGGEAMRDQDGGRLPGGGQRAIEDLRFPADVELRGRFVEQHHTGAEADGGKGSGERDALP